MVVKTCVSRGVDRFQLGGSRAIVPFLGVVYHHDPGKVQVTAVATFTRICEFDDYVMTHKPVRELGQDIRTLPTYTIPEAASFLAIPTRTLFEWYAGQKPVLKPSGRSAGVALLSFRDLEESYKVHLLRSKEDYSLQYLRNAMAEARDE